MKSRGMLKLSAAAWLLWATGVNVSSETLPPFVRAPAAPGCSHSRDGRPPAQTVRQDGGGAPPASPAEAPCGLEPSRKIDAYGETTPADEQARLEKFMALLGGESEDVKGFIVAYAGRTARAGAAQARADRAKEFLVEKNVSHNVRLNTLDCGRRETAETELWITPVATAPPPCAATFKPAGARPTAPARRPPARRPRG